MKNLKKVISILLSLALCFSAVYTGFVFTASAKSLNEFIVNGDFEDGKKGYMFADESETNIKIYDNADETRPGYGEVTLDGKAAYLDGYAEGAYAKANQLQYKIVNLPKGNYSISFDVALNNLNPSGWSLMTFGVAKALNSTYSTAYGQASIATSVTVTENGEEVTVSTATNSSYYYIKCANLTEGWHDLDVTVNFTITDETRVYFYTFCGGTSATDMNAAAYIDNITLAESTDSAEDVFIVNGNFEGEELGYMYADEAATNTKIYDNDDTTRPGYEDNVTLDGRAAYVEGYGPTTGYYRNYTLQYEIKNLPAGDYTISTDILLQKLSGSTSSDNVLYFGLTKEYNTTHSTPYGKALISNSASLTKNGTAVNYTTGNYYRVPGNALENGWHDLDLELTFSLSGTTTVYFYAICAGNATTRIANAYFDNIVLEKVEQEVITEPIVNGDFEEGQKGYLYADEAETNIKVYDNADTTRPGYEDNVTLDGKAAYVEGYGPTAGYYRNYSLQYEIVDLPAGDYTISTDILLQKLSGSTSSDNVLYFGLTKEYNTTHSTPYGKALISNSASLTKNGTAVNYTTGNYYRVPGNALDNGWHDLDLELTFTLSETTTVYFYAICAGNATTRIANAYFDNIALVKNGGYKVIENGDFEEGKKGYMFAEDANTNIEIFDNDDATRPGYGEVELDNKAAYVEGFGANVGLNAAVCKDNFLQYKISDLSAGQYAISMDVLLNLIDPTVFAPIAFGVTKEFKPKYDTSYGSSIISDSVVITENGNNVTTYTGKIYHCIPENTLSAGWHDLDVSVSFTLDEESTVYFFLFLSGDGTEDTMDATAYIDNVDIYKSATFTSSYVNVLGESLKETEVKHKRVGPNVICDIPEFANYNFMGYKVGADGEVVKADKFVSPISANTDIISIYALQGDLNDDMFVNALDLTEMRKYFLLDSNNINIYGADANGDGHTDITDLVRLKKKIANLELEDKKIVNADIDKLRDPFMLVENDVYYLYGTGGKLYKNTSRTLSGSWQYVGIVAQTPENVTENLFWAPEVYNYNGSYYMITSYYSPVNEKRGCAIFEADSPEGPFVQITDGTITPADKSCIDGTLYIDNDNQPWLIYSEEYIEAENNIGGMYAAKLSADLTSLVSQPIELFRANELPWSSGGISEGPFMYRCENGELLMLVTGFRTGTGNDRYSVGIARSSNGDIDGEWTFDETLLYSSELSSEGYDGGHGMIFKSLTGQLYLSIHSPNDVDVVSEKPVFIPIREENNTLVWDVK